MARVPITIMGFRCDRCGHEWIPHDIDHEPRVCPNQKCHSPYWNTPGKRAARMTYDDFKTRSATFYAAPESPLRGPKCEPRRICRKRTPTISGFIGWKQILD